MTVSNLKDRRTRVDIDAVTPRPRATTAIAAASILIVVSGAGIAIGRGSAHHAQSPSAASPTAPSSPLPASESPGSPRTAARPAHQHPAAAQLAAALGAAIHHALARKTAHSTARDVSGRRTTSFDNYDGVNVGRQLIAINGGHLEVRVVGNATYLRGDAKGLAVYHIDAKVLGGKWLKLVPGQAGYQDITAGVTLASALAADKISGPLRGEPDTTIGGQRVRGVSGRGSGANSPAGARATMWISRSTGLPVEFDALTRTTHIVVTFSDWGAPVHVATPANVYGQQTLSG